MTTKPGYPDTDYLSAMLELTESGRGETALLRISPRFDEPQVELQIEEAEDERGDGALIILNRRQIECLADFLVAWLNRAPSRRRLRGLV